MLKKLTKYSFALLGMLVLLNSCKKDYESIESIDDAKIQAYIKKNNLTMTKDPSGFYYQVLTAGTGAPLANRDSIFYTLSIKSLDGASYYNTPTYGNEANYVGYAYPSPYRIALVGVNRGSKVRVILPSYLAYGKNGNNAVPSNEVIVSELTTYSEDKQWEIDDKKIIAFLAAKGITATKEPNRVYTKVNELGVGVAVDISSTVTVKYTGRLLNGTVFDQTTGDQTFATTIVGGGLIKGWEALIGVPQGSKIRIFVPSDLAYGPAGNTGIPGNSILDFDIEIVEVTN